MIKSLDIESFGSYSNFSWDNSIRNDHNTIIHFNELNIIYGKNYSGKTTLSKIFQSLEERQLPSNYGSIKFSINVGSEQINSDSLFNSDKNVRVYNSSFVEKNLSFLSSNSGGISTFAILGEENVGLLEEIESLSIDLGDNDSGVIKELGSCNEEYENLSRKYSDQEKSIDSKLRGKAKQIKENSDYSNPIYDIRTLKKDIIHINNNGIEELSPEDIDIRKRLLRELKRELIEDYNLECSLNVKEINSALSRHISPSTVISRLSGNDNLNAWVYEGHKKHSDGKKCCFCEQELPKGMSDKLDAHFNKEYEDFITVLDRVLAKASFLRKKVMKLPDKINFYDSLHSSYDLVDTRLNVFRKKFNDYLDVVINRLNTKRGNVFHNNPLEVEEFDFSELNLINEEISRIINEHNTRSMKLNDHQFEARKSLRLNDVDSFLKLVEYDSMIDDFNHTKQERDVALKKFNDKKREVESIYSQISSLKVQLHDERKGAEKINDYLTAFFPNIKLSLEVDIAEEEYKFRIFRDGIPAYNLSEGECSVVSFCYFMAKLNDTESFDRELIIFIDDPISSLDNNNIFSIFNMIEVLIAKEKKYEQLFISTHNLDFLKYLKRLTGVARKRESFIVSNSAGKSKISLMPGYLKNYITEFNFLFAEINNCRNEDNINSNYGSFYNFANNLRKFLESYLFFKYPFSQSPSQDHNSRIERFFGPDQSALAQRIMNEFSHLSEQFDRAERPIDVQEINKLADMVLTRMEEVDKEQYDCLMESIS